MWHLRIYRKSSREIVRDQWAESREVLDSAAAMYDADFHDIEIAEEFDHID